MSTRIEEACERFETAWKTGQRPRIEAYLQDWVEPQLTTLLRRLLALEISLRTASGEAPEQDEYIRVFPFHLSAVQAVFGQSLLHGPDSQDPPQPSTARPHSDLRTAAYDGISTGEDEDVSVVREPIPEKIGRYTVERLINEGGFGTVYLARDDTLDRQVAIKVPRIDRISEPDDIDAYWEEARVVASLDHPHIVPVYDVGQTDDGLCFVVSKLIEGTDLAAQIRQKRYSYSESARLVAVVAEALHHAHSRKLVHRDVKPANILIDLEENPYVADFGLALREQDFGKNPAYAGTFAYMSPEQARGEGHLVDGRSDIFSLGMVFYELLAGQRPYASASGLEVLRQISKIDVRPPRQLDDRIPKELERICMKALSKRAADRYTTALDMADDLQHYLATCGPADLVREGSYQPADKLNSSLQLPANMVVPKGLRSFDLDDADFFVDLLPGPRDREGLPESIRFWKTRLEATDADDTFRVGVMYGPSGCGKSSLIKAGILPRLSDDVLSVHIEADATDTEARLLKRLRKSIPQLPASFDLVESLACLRRSRGIIHHKVVIVFDQFEQWLHGHRDDDEAELMKALRQCDGERVQAVLLIRDDFWMAATRFMRQLEVPIVEGRNSVAVDLFDPLHARKVLWSFGRSFGRLPDHEAELSTEQKRFLNDAVSELTQLGMVIPVRLALFAEMIKGRPWVPSTLKALGGTEGVSVTFLEETFSSPTAPPEHRLHQAGARAVLKKLLPEAGVNITGHMRSQTELREAAGYADRPRDFEELIRILDSETRLLTPIDPEAVVGADDNNVKSHKHEKYYHLTHDYLVPALRRWLTRKQRETRRGRAQLLLAERADLWQAKPDKRSLPSVWEYLRIRLLAPDKDWKESEKSVMQKAGRHHLLRAIVFAFVLLPLFALGLHAYGRWVDNVAQQRADAEKLVNQLVFSPTAEVPDLVEKLSDEPLRRWATPLIQSNLVAAEATSTESAETSARLSDRNRAEIARLHLSLAALKLLGDESQIAYLRDQMLLAEAEQFQAIVRVLTEHQHLIADELAKLIRMVSPAGATERELEKFARQQANGAIALLLLGTHEDEAWRLLRHSKNPRTRSQLVHRFARLGLRPEQLVGRFPLDQEKSIRRALILSLGEFTAADFPEAAREKLKSQLLEWYQKDKDAGVRSATEWLCRRWGWQDALRELDSQWWGKGQDFAEIKRQLIRHENPNGWGWYLTRDLSHTMVVVPRPDEPYWRGSPADEVGRESHEKRFLQDLPRSFAIGLKEVTAEQFLVFRPDHYYGDRRQWTPDNQCPVTYVSWYDAAEYCNALNEQENIPEGQWCYERNQMGEMVLPDDYLRRIGYRLPTEAEWEYACRAGADTSRYYGSSTELLCYYAWYMDNSGRERLLQVGRLKPNDFGLFDMLGNTAEWCQDREPETIFQAGPVVTDVEDPGPVLPDEGRLYRGGKFTDVPKFLRCANQTKYQAAGTLFTQGFRVVRTIEDDRQ